MGLKKHKSIKILGSCGAGDDKYKMELHAGPSVSPPYASPSAQIPVVNVQHEVTPTQGSYSPGLLQPVKGHGFQSNAPRGLAYLDTLDQVFMKQKLELLEAFTGCETQNRYHILDPQGRQIFYAKEDTDCCTRWCCGKIRPFDMKRMEMDRR